jgi:hypothetical protein
VRPISSCAAAICMRQKARRRSRLGLRSRCLADAILHHEQLRDTPCTCLPMSAFDDAYVRFDARRSVRAWHEEGAGGGGRGSLSRYFFRATTSGK